jgi:BNR repeat-like domain
MTILQTILLAVLLGLLLNPSPVHAFVSIPPSPFPGAAVTPRLRVDPGGTLYLIWRQAPDPQSGQIFFTRSPDRGQIWPQDVHHLDRERPGGSRSSSPRVDSDRHGHVYAVWWTKHRDGTKDVLMRSSQDFGTSFGPPLKLNESHGAFPPEISADGQGHIYVVWSDERAYGEEASQGGKSSSHRIYINRSDDHGATWLPQDLQLSGKTAGSRGRVIQSWPQIRSNDQGHVYVIWFDTRAGGSSIYFRASDDFGRTWREERRIKGDGGDVEGPMQLAATDQGHLYVVWADNRDGEYGIYLVASTDHGLTWSEAVRLDVAKGKVARASLPTLAADPSGHVYVAWQDARHGGWDIYLNRSADFGKTWNPEGLRLNTGPAGEAEAQLPQLALDGTGTVAVAWQEDRGDEQREGIYLTWSSDFGKTWLNADLRVDDPSAGGRAVRPQIAMLPDGAVVIAWEMARHDRSDIAVKVVAPSVRQTSTR